MADEETEEKPEPKKTKPLVERASTIPKLDLAFGYYWEVEGKLPEWNTFVGHPEIFRQALADALTNRRMTRLYFAADGIWIEMPIPQLK